MGILSGNLVGVLFCQQFQLLHQTGIMGVDLSHWFCLVIEENPVETPKNQAAEHFKLVEDRKEAEKVFAKLRGRNCGFYIVPGSKKKDGEEQEALNNAMGENNIAK